MLKLAENKKRRRTLSRDWRETWGLFILAVPAVIYYIIFHYCPMVGSIIAFKDYNYADGIFKSAWVGWKNFEFFFTSQDAWRLLRNTIGYNAAFLVLDIVLGMTIALLLFEVKRKVCLKYFQTTMLLPHFVSWVIVAYMVYILLNPVHGMFNKALRFFGGTEIQWYSEPKYWVTILIAAKEWKSIGMGSIVYYAALMGVDASLYEAATVDGAGRWKQTLHISIPSLIPVAVILGILAVGNMIRGDFGLFYQIPRDVGALYPTTDVIDTYVYRGLRGGDIGITSAVGLFQSFVGLILVVLTNLAVKKIDPEKSLF